MAGRAPVGMQNGITTLTISARYVVFTGASSALLKDQLGTADIVDISFWWTTRPGKQVPMSVSPEVTRHVLVASDFDQTLSFNDSGHVLSELLGASNFGEKVAGLARSNLVHQGGEL